MTSAHHHDAASHKVHHRQPSDHVATIAALAPNTIGWLQIPLTPARAARLAELEVSRGIDPQQLVLDLLDDVIFAREVA